MSYIKWLRSKVGKRKILLTFASIVLRDETGGILLQRRSDFDAWGLPGGVMEIGESILACARRELYEETGLTAGVLSLVGVYSEPTYDTLYPNGDRAQQHTICFQAKASGGDLRVDGLESRALAFFEPEHIPLPEVLPWYQAMLRDALAQDPSTHIEPAFGSPVIDSLPLPQVSYMRRLVGEDPFIAAGAMAVIAREDHAILMIQHGTSGRWFLPGAYLHIGENAAHAAQRAALQETGLQVTVQRLIGIHSPPASWNYPGSGALQPVITVFLCQASGSYSPAETSTPLQLAWIPADQIPALDASPSQSALHQAVVKHLQSGYFIL